MFLSASVVLLHLAERVPGPARRCGLSSRPAGLLRAGDAPRLPGSFAIVFVCLPYRVRQLTTATIGLTGRTLAHQLGQFISDQALLRALELKPFHLCMTIESFVRQAGEALVRGHTPGGRESHD